MKRTSGLLPRRNLLKYGLGTLGLASAPFAFDRRSNAAEAVAPKRLILVYSPNGTIQEEFWPTAGASETDFTLNRIGEPLAPFKDRLLYLKGLDMAVVEAGPGGPHQKGVGGLFTNEQLQEGVFMDGDGSRAGWANGISIDQEVARWIGQDTHLTSLELGVRAIDNEVRARISYAGPGNPMPPMNSPSAAFKRLFSTYVGVDDALRAQRSLVIDSVAKQYASLQPRLSQVDRQKLQQHLDIVNEIERRMSVPQAACTAPTAPEELADDDETTMDRIADLQVQLLGAAIACDLTRVASLQFFSAINEIRFPFLNSTGTGHSLSHSSDSDLEAREQLVVRHRWMAEKIAALMTLLDSIPEGDGSALDNTLIVWGNELGLGNSHSSTDIPFLLAGGGAELRMGRFLQYQSASHGSLLTSIARAVGVPLESFGNVASPSTPLTGLG